MFIQMISDFTQIRPSATPAMCFLSHSPKQPGDVGVISTAREITQDQVGFFPEFSEGVVKEMASQFGMVTKENAEQLRANNRRQGLEIKKLTAQLAAAQEFIATGLATDTAATGD